jgi:hypothetical protein
LIELPKGTYEVQTSGILNSVIGENVLSYSSQAAIISVARDPLVLFEAFETINITRVAFALDLQQGSVAPLPFKGLGIARLDVSWRNLPVKLDASCSPSTTELVGYGSDGSAAISAPAGQVSPETITQSFTLTVPGKYAILIRGKDDTEVRCSLTMKSTRRLIRSFDDLSVPLSGRVSTIQTVPFKMRSEGLVFASKLKNVGYDFECEDGSGGSNVSSGSKFVALLPANVFCVLNISEKQDGLRGDVRIQVSATPTPNESRGRK